ncbi:hypothetical protein [Pedobacter sp. D749]|uniref:hypothetical protein n=1 Tax=Pedobacter sp. D749 TaxID=2856523 RepID=UPI001C58EBEE|nr:hypothetical protein [Pedobacter sp. D749]QXU39692.1 hypothetical protein KYH19_11685 [Pedobacter sp. D749]
MNLLIDSALYTQGAFGDSFGFLLEHGLIEVKQYLKSYKVVFVGEVITPYHHFIALPKNFEDHTQENISLTINLLKTFRGLKRKEKLLIENKSFETGKEIESEFYYWKKLYGFFMDYITYEFYYPRQKLFIHSSRPKLGRVNPMLTDINRGRYGNGITYQIKDFATNEIRDVYYTVLKSLQEKYASTTESRKIAEMEEFLKRKGIAFKQIAYDDKQVITTLRTTQFNPVYELVIKTLLAYIENSSIQVKNKINVFYSKAFEYVYQYMLQAVLDSSTGLKPINWTEPSYKTLHPDLIHTRFIGDAKYYNLKDYLRKPFEKELYAYNVANHNAQINLVMIPSEQNAYLSTLTHSPFNLEVITISLQDIYNDFITGKKDCLAFIDSVIHKRTDNIR